jgi:SAM-dependent methyltransferase
MPFSDYLLYRLARNWPSPVEKLNARIGAPLESDEYHMGYALHQFNQRVRNGIRMEVFGKDILEIGCGHGGVSLYMVAAGARSVVGIDMSAKALEYARRLADKIAANFGEGARLPVHFTEMNAYELDFPPESFDLVVADNAFEHFSDPERVMRCVHRVLRPGGGILVPNFPPYYSKYGLHLKTGLKLPWANLFFSERTIVRTLQRLAAERPILYEVYPGLKNNPQCVRDVREYRDLNGITNRKFKAWATNSGFRVEWFRPSYTRIGKVLSIVPGFRGSILEDVFSDGSSAYLVVTDDSKAKPEPVVETSLVGSQSP